MRCLVTIALGAVAAVICATGPAAAQYYEDEGAPVYAVNRGIVTMVAVVRPDTRSRAANADRIVVQGATIMAIRNADTMSSGIARAAVLRITLGRAELANLTAGRSNRPRSRTGKFVGW